MWAIDVRSNGYLDPLNNEHEIELERTKTAMSDAANQIMGSMASHYNQIIGNRDTDHDVQKGLTDQVTQKFRKLKKKIRRSQTTFLRH